MDLEITPIAPPSFNTSSPIQLSPVISEIPVSTVSVQPFQSSAAERQLGANISIRSTTEPHRLIYGSVRTGGVITFAHAAHESSVAAEHLHVVVTLAGHQINDIPNLYLDGEEVTFGGGTIHVDTRWGSSATKWNDLVFMSKSLGSESQASNVDLKSQSEANFPGYWTENHRQRGCAYAYLILKFDPDVFVNGLPKIEFGIEGKDDVYDPRDTTNKYTRNAALIIADYLCNAKLGLGANYSTEIDETNLIAAANICDESVSILPSGSESRYTIDGVIDTSRSPRSILQEMSDAIAGPIVYSEGTWKIFPGEYRTPVITLTEDDLRSEVKLQTKQSRRSTFNAIKGTHLNADGKTVDFPAVRNATYEAEDGDEVLWHDINLPLTRTASAAQRIGKIALEDNRQDIILEANFGLKAFQLAAEDNVYLTLDRFGFSSKVFRVVKWKPITVSNNNGQELQIAMTLKETASAIYTWSTEETTVDVAPNTTLPDPSTVTAPQNLTLESGTNHLYLRSDGTVFSRIRASWDTITDPYVTNVEVEYKKSSDSDFEPATIVSGSQSNTYILDVEDGENYDVRVRSVNGYGNKSSWTNELFHTVVGKTAAPSNVSNLTSSVGSYGIRLTWDQIPDKDLSHYVIKNGDTVLDNAFTNSFTWEIQTAATYNIAVYAVDTSGNVSAAETTLSVTIANPGTPAVAASIDGTDVVLSWPEVAKASNGFAIDAYEISYGSTYGASTALNETKSSQFRTRVSWGDTRKFWIVARDVAGNRSTETSVDVDIAAPSSPTNFAANIIDNNVALSWSAPSSGSLPISHYQVYRGSTFGSATSLGKVSATFKTHFEMTKGTYTYWLTAVDSAGNESDEVSLTAVVTSPPDYVLNDDSQVTGDYCKTTNALAGTRDSSIDSYDISALNPTLWLKADAGVTADSSGRVATWADQSGNSFDFSQSTDGNKPLLTTTGTENFLLQSEDFTTTWTAGRISRAADATTAPDGNTTADSIIASTANNSHYILQNYNFVSGESYRFSVFAKQLDAGGGGHHVALRLDNGAMPNNTWATFDLVNGTADATTGNGAAATIEDVGSGWYRCTLTQTADASALAGAVIYPLATGDSTSGIPDDWVFAGDGSDGIYLWGAQLNRVSSPVDYVKTLAAKALPGFNGKQTIRFDGAASKMESTQKIGHLISADKYIAFVAGVIRSTTTNAANGYNNHCVLVAKSGAWSIAARTTDTISVGHYDGDTQDAESSYTEGTPFVFRGYYDGTDIKSDVDLGTEASVAQGNGTLVTTASGNELIMGADVAGTTYLEFDAAEIIVLDADYTPGVYQDVQRYLNHRWLDDSAQTADEELGDFILPVDVTATLSDNVTDSGVGNTTFDDMIADGYTFPLQPTPGTSEIQRVIDYGTTLSSSLITLSWNKTNINSNVDISAQIDYSSDGSSWTSATAGATQVFASSFRYVRVTITGTPDDDKSLAKLENVRVRLDVKKSRESGSGTANSGDSGGTTVTLQKSWIDIDSVQLTASGTTSFASLVRSGGTGANPTDFKVLAFDESGSRITVDFDYLVTGIESND